MVRIVIDEPFEADPDLQVPLKFARGCKANNLSVIGLADKAVENCQSLRARYTNNRYILNLSGIISFIMLNREAAMRFWGAALLASPRYTSAVNALDDMIAADPDWTNMADYLALAAQGNDAFIAFYASRAETAFADRAYGEADRWLQRISAFHNPGLAQLEPIEACKLKSQRLHDSGAMAVTLNTIAAGYQNYWSNISDASIRASNRRYENVPDRIQMADIAAGLAELNGPVSQTIVELGCFAGFNLQLTAGCLSSGIRARTTLIGIEPNATACRIGREISPDVTFVHGGFSELLAGKLDIPEHIDICIVSRVFMILEQQFVAAILDHLRTRIKTLVVCDDILNFDGHAVTVRMPDNFIIMHPFQKILTEAGFEIVEVIMSKVPDRECTGFIVAVTKPAAPADMPLQRL